MRSAAFSARDRPRSMGRSSLTWGSGELVTAAV
jgi:hypothetical protein